MASSERVRTAETGASEPERQARPVDFRRPSKFGREHVRSLEVAHEVFARRFATALGATLRALVQLEPVSIDQVSYDDYTRSMPNPNLIGIIGLPTLPGGIVVDMGVQLGLQLVDRMLGGSGTPAGLRRPTDIEKHLLRDLVEHAVGAVGETLAPLLDAPPELSAVEYNPQLVQIAAPSDMVLLLSYRVTVSHGTSSQGLITLCYPSSTLAPVLDRLDAQGAGLASEDADGADPEARRAMTEQLRDVAVALDVRLSESSVPAGDLAALRVGDVLRLDHRVGMPLGASIGGATVLQGHLGRRGRRLALQISGWVADTAATHEA